MVRPSAWYEELIISTEHPFTPEAAVVSLGHLAQALA